MDEAEALSKTARGALVAAAGCGKTHLIAAAVGKGSGRRELVLTHTHAGVDALRSRLREMGVPPSTFRVDTIAGWALRYAASFPKTSGLSVLTPSKDGWNETYPAAVRVLQRKPIKQILRDSYSGVYVDEYQDCTVQQHELVLALANVLPCRLLGDPLQGIFSFGQNQPIDWRTHVEPTFSDVPGPTYPWRWKKTNPELGDWLQNVRSDLLAGREIKLGRDRPVRWLRLGSGYVAQQQAAACRKAACGSNDTVVAISKRNWQCYKAARSLRGMYSCVEPIECDDLAKWAGRIGAAQGSQRAVEVIDFAAKCLTGIKTELRGVRSALEAGKPSRSKKYHEQVEALSAVASSDSLTPVLAALNTLSKVPGVPPDRRELLSEMKRAIREYAGGSFDDLPDAAWKVRNRTRILGRRLARFCMGTTLLVKGLEFDHAVILNADELDRENLYVAMTRGKKSLTVLSREPVLRPSW